MYFPTLHSSNLEHVRHEEYRVYNTILQVVDPIHNEHIINLLGDLLTMIIPT